MAGGSKTIMKDGTSNSTNAPGDSSTHTNVAKFISSGQAQEQIQSDLNNVFNWTIDKNMPFNLDKFTYLKLGKRQMIFTSTDTRSKKGV